jgi:hypothetical protein
VPPQVLAGALPSIQAHVSRYLAKDDPRRLAVDEIVQHRAAPAPAAPPAAGQILGWAVIFGIAQQLVTRFADSKAAGLLESVQGQGAGGERPLKRDQPA